jgi:photosystem II stability/assembly factor-like uncharacterized protein
MARREDRRPKRTLGAVSIALAILTSALSASANGRYPFAQQLLVDPSDPNRLWLRATYGILTSADAGVSWGWVCEAAVGYDPLEDPMLAITGDGRIFVGATHGLFRTSDHGCSWSADTDIGDRTILDLAVEHDGKHVLALTKVNEKNGNYDLVVFRSDDQAERFAALGPPISLDLLGQTVDPAPSDSNRIYVTGVVYPLAPAADAGPSQPDASPNLGDAPGILMRSRDAGGTWERLRIPGASLDKPPFIAAVHPTNPDVLYVRVQGEARASGPIDSFLLYTDDAGGTWKEIFRGSADMLGFSLSEDGGEVRIGLGASQDPNDPSSGRQVDPGALGIYRANAPTFSFTHLLVGQVGCLTDAGPRLYMCGSHDSEHFEVGVSTDDGVTASGLVDLQGVRGVAVCPPTSTTALQCADQWQYVCGQLGHCSTPTRDAGTVPAPSGGGCGCGSPAGAKSKSQPPTTGTARLEMVPEPLEAFAVTSALVAWLARRRQRARQERHREPRSTPE